jgi:hypothetical protein
MYARSVVCGCYVSWDVDDAGLLKATTNVGRVDSSGMAYGQGLQGGAYCDVMYRNEIILEQHDVRIFDLYAGEVLDQAGAVVDELLDFFGEAITMERLKFVQVEVKSSSGTDGSVLVGGTGSIDNEWPNGDPYEPGSVIPVFDAVGLLRPTSFVSFCVGSGDGAEMGEDFSGVALAHWDNTNEETAVVRILFGGDR